MDDKNLTLNEGAIALHELYLSYFKAGFTKEQAMQIICAIITKHSPQENKDDE